MTNDNRDIFAARLRHELTQETHVVVGDHPPEPRHISKRRALAMGYRSGTMRDDEYATRIGSARTGSVEYKMEPIPRDIAERQLDLYAFALTGGPHIPDEEAAIDGAAHHPIGDASYRVKPCERCQGDRYIGVHANLPDVPCPVCNTVEPPATRYAAEPVNQATQLTEAPVDSPICKCHDRMGNDWYFLPSGACLFDIDECTDPQRRKLKT